MLAEVAAECLYFYKHYGFSVNIHRAGMKRSADMGSASIQEGKPMLTAKEKGR
jgi:hypothetical protein